MSDSSLIPFDKSRSDSNGKFPIALAAPEGYRTADLFGETKNFREKIADAIDLVVRRKFTFLITVGAIVGLSVLISVLTTEIYEADAWVFVELEENTKSVSVTPVTGVDGQTGETQRFVTAKRTLAGELLLLEISDPLAKRVARRLIEMRTVPGSQRALSIFEGSSPDSMTLDQVAQRLEGFIEFEAESEDANVIRIRGVSEVAAEAALVANLHANEYVRLTQEANRSNYTATREFLEAQETRWKQELYEAEEAVTATSGTRGSAALSQRSSLVIGQLATLEVQRDEKLIELRMRRSALETTKEELAQISPTLAERIASSENQQIELLRSSVAELENERREILARFPAATPSTHRRLGQIEADLESLNAELDQLTQRFVEKIDNSLGVVGTEGLGYVADLRRRVAQEEIAISGLESQIDALQRRIRDYEGELQQLPRQVLGVARLERDRVHAAQMYETVVRRLQDALIAEQSEPGYARIIREAAVPWIPSEPNYGRNLLLGALFGLFFGFAVSILLDKADNRLFRPESVESLGQDLVAVIPNMDSFIRSEHGDKSILDIDGKMVASTVVAASSPTSGLAESYRGLRTILQFTSRTDPPRSIVVTSANMGEGKSVTAANLAVVMAQAGKKTLLVDGDMRRPRIHSLLGAERHPGLSQMLSGEISSVDVLQDIGFENLTIIGAGPWVDNPAELLASVRFSDFVKRQTELYDMVIIDTPPVRAASDAIVTSALVDGTLLVTRAGSTRTDEMKSTIQQLETVGSTIIGVVFNGFEIGMAYGYRYRYSGYDQYTGYQNYDYGISSEAEGV